MLAGMHTDARQLSTRGAWTLGSQPGVRHIPTQPEPRCHEVPRWQGWDLGPDGWWQQRSRLWERGRAWARKGLSETQWRQLVCLSSEPTLVGSAKILSSFVLSPRAVNYQKEGPTVTMQ